MDQELLGDLELGESGMGHNRRRSSRNSQFLLCGLMRREEGGGDCPESQSCSRSC